jgi:hypothetical protein
MSSTLTGQSFEIYGVRIRFTSTVAEHYVRLAEDYGLYFVDDDGRSADLSYDVILGDGQRCDVPDVDRTIVGPLGDEILLRTNGSVLLTGPTLEDPRAYTLEVRAYLTASVLRQLVRARTAQQFHASAVHGSRGAVLYAGAKKMGKTSMALLSALGGAQYMSNDITLLDVAQDVRVFGMPQALSVGLGAVKWFAERYPGIGLDASQIAADLDDVGLYNLEIGEKPRLERQTLERMAAVRREPSRLAAIVFPEPYLSLSRPRIRRLDRDEAITRLAMLAEAFLKWQWPVALSADDYLDRVREVMDAGVSQAECWHFQWCPDHELNLSMLTERVL